MHRVNIHQWNFRPQLCKT